MHCVRQHAINCRWQDEEMSQYAAAEAVMSGFAPQSGTQSRANSKLQKLKDKVSPDMQQCIATDAFHRVHTDLASLSISSTVWQFLRDTIL